MATLSEVLEANENRGNLPEDVITAYYENDESYHSREAAEDVCRMCEDAFQGIYESVEDYVGEYLENTGVLHEIPENLRGYFDYKAFARDLELGGDIWVAELGFCEVAIFSSY